MLHRPPARHQALLLPGVGQRLRHVPGLRRAALGRLLLLLLLQGKGPDVLLQPLARRMQLGGCRTELVNHRLEGLHLLLEGMDVALGAEVLQEADG